MKLPLFFRKIKVEIELLWRTLPSLLRTVEEEKAQGYRCIQAHGMTWEYLTRWGNDRRAQGPLEMRRCGDVYEWRYLSDEWNRGPIPPEIVRPVRGVT